MIKRIYRSKLDIENLSKLKTSIEIEADSFDYKKVIVKKPWGYEYLMFENSNAAAWILFLKKGHRTSMHCHPTKKTSLIVLSGEVVCSTLEGWEKRKEGEGLIIEEAVFHTTQATSKGGSLIMEIEFPPNKRDLVRLNDEYGRENLGYEGKDAMLHDFDGYEYIDFHNIVINHKHSKRLRSCEISINYHDKNSVVDDVIKKEASHILYLLEGKLYSEDGNLLLSAGECISNAEIKSIPKIFTLGDILYLSLKWKKKQTK